jgi:hypothetical protein
VIVNRIVQIAVLLAALGALAPAHAELTAYPISGRWASVQADERPDCRRPPFMEFKGDRRFDFGNSSAPEYRALSIVPVAGAAYKIVELVFTGAVEGKLTYTLHVRDTDHASMHLQADGRVIALKRCA